MGTDANNRCIHVVSQPGCYRKDFFRLFRRFFRFGAYHTAEAPVCRKCECPIVPSKWATVVLGFSRELFFLPLPFAYAYLRHIVELPKAVIVFPFLALCVALLAARAAFFAAILMRCRWRACGPTETGVYYEDIASGWYNGGFAASLVLLLLLYFLLS